MLGVPANNIQIEGVVVEKQGRSVPVMFTLSHAQAGKKTAPTYEIETCASANQAGRSERIEWCATYS